MPPEQPGGTSPSAGDPARPGPRPAPTAPSAGPTGRRLVGERLGPYAITGTLGEGGMGVVFAAHHVELDRPAALKILRIGGGPRAQARLRREAQTIARLEHPGIVRVYDVGETPDGLPFIAMELVAGTDLGTLIDRGAVSLDERLRVIADAARALQFAHEHRVIHRDVKPQNILVTGDGQVKVLDFGIGKNLDGETVTRLTATGVLIGTLAYMAPEQVRDDATVDVRTDVYALGATLYEAVSRQPPVADDNPARAVFSILSRVPPPPSSIAPRGTFDAPGAPAPAAIDAVCARALAKDPVDRYASAEQLADEIDRMRAGQAPTTSPPRSRARRRLPPAAGVLLLVAGAFAGGIVVGRRTAPEPTPTPTPTPKADPPASEGPGEIDRPAGATAEEVAGSDPGPDATPPATGDADALAAVLPALDAAGSTNDFAALLAAYRSLDLAGDLDRLARAVEALPPDRRVVPLAPAILHEAGRANPDGMRRARAMLDAVVVELSHDDPAAATKIAMASALCGSGGRLVLDLIDESLEGNPILAREWRLNPARHPVIGNIPPRDVPKVRDLVAAALGDEGLRALQSVTESRQFAAAIIRGQKEPDPSLPIVIPDQILQTPRMVPAMLERTAGVIERSKLREPLRTRVARALARLAEFGRSIVTGPIQLDPADGVTPVALRAEPPEAWSVTDGGHLMIEPRPESERPWHAAEVHLTLGDFLTRFDSLELEVIGPHAPPMLGVELLIDGERASGVLLIDQRVQVVGTSVPELFFQSGWTLARAFREQPLDAPQTDITRTFAIEVQEDGRSVRFLIDGNEVTTTEASRARTDEERWDLRLYVPPITEVSGVRLRRRGG